MTTERDQPMPDELNTTSSHLLRTLSRIVDEIIGELDPPSEYRTSEQVAAWTRGALDAQRAIEKVLKGQSNA